MIWKVVLESSPVLISSMKSVFFGLQGRGVLAGHVQKSSHKQDQK